MASLHFSRDCSRKRFFSGSAEQYQIAAKPKTAPKPFGSPGIAVNVVDQDFTASKPNEVWLTDMTYIETQEGWLYLAAVVDLYSRRLVGWSIDRTTAADVLFRGEVQVLGALRGRLYR
jgi:transposase InsO family protein